LCLLQARSLAAGMRVVPFPEQNFVRQLHLFARAGEYGELPQRVAQLACEILKRECAPELRKLVPWLRGQFAIGPAAR